MHSFAQEELECLSLRNKEAVHPEPQGTRSISMVEFMLMDKSPER